MLTKSAWTKSGAIDADKLAAYLPGMKKKNKEVLPETILAEISALMPSLGFKSRTVTRSYCECHGDNNRTELEVAPQKVRRT